MKNSNFNKLFTFINLLVLSSCITQAISGDFAQFNNELEAAIAAIKRVDDADNIIKLIGKNVKLTFKNGDTPLHLVARKVNQHNAVNWDRVIVYLIENGANIHARNNLGETPLSIVSRPLVNADLDDDNIWFNRASFITAVSPQEIQHIIPAAISLTKRQTLLGKDVGRLVTKELIPEFIKGKLTIAVDYMDVQKDNDFTIEMLRNYIINSAQRVIKKANNKNPINK
ncbi:MAG: ankyrin repeat domain-containing protein [Candidatus Babeliales bacterium]